MLNNLRCRIREKETLILNSKITEVSLLFGEHEIKAVMFLLLVTLILLLAINGS